MITPRTTPEPSHDSKTFDLYTYVRCMFCAHFVVFEDDEDQWTHLDNGEQQLSDHDEKYDHDAAPGQAMLLRDWKLRYPVLFERFPDGEIGPNSKHFPFTKGFRQEALPGNV